MGSQKQGFALCFLCFLFLNTLYLATADVQYYDFILQESNLTKLCSTKSVLTANGSFPGPEIRVRRGDTVLVNVLNEASYGVIVDWHGVKQWRNLNLTQNPIQPGRNFTYEVKLSDEIGTVWWHAQSINSSLAMVAGALVILPAANETYPFHPPNADQTIILSPWFKGDSASNVSDAYTINGHPGNSYGCPNDTTYTLQVDYGNIYLLRVVNSVRTEGMFFSIANHSMMIVGQDGGYVKRFTSDYILVGPGQAMDVLVPAYQNIGRYCMAARPFLGAAAAAFNNINITEAVLVYTNSNEGDQMDLPVPVLPATNDSVAARSFASRIIKGLNGTEP